MISLPPVILFHGTRRAALRSIQDNGLLAHPFLHQHPQRFYEGERGASVYLTPSPDVARKWAMDEVENPADVTILEVDLPAGTQLKPDEQAPQAERYVGNIPPAWIKQAWPLNANGSYGAPMPFRNGIGRDAPAIRRFIAVRHQRLFNDDAAIDASAAAKAFKPEEHPRDKTHGAEGGQFVKKGEEGAGGGEPAKPGGGAKILKFPPPKPISTVGAPEAPEEKIDGRSAEPAGERRGVSQQPLATVADPYTRRDIRGARSLRVRSDGARAKSVFEPSPELREALERVGSEPATYHELEPGSGAKFAEHITASKRRSFMSRSFGAAVHVYKPEEYDEMRLFATPDGKAGFALHGNDIVSVFKAAGGPKKAVSSMLALAVAQGGQRLDCFDTALPDIYAYNGFRAVARLPFNDEDKPEGGDYKTFDKFNDGRPDVVFMAYDPAYDGPYVPGDGAHVGDYDDGTLAQQRALGNTGLRGSQGHAALISSRRVITVGAVEGDRYRRVDMDAMKAVPQKADNPTVFDHNMGLLRNPRFYPMFKAGELDGKSSDEIADIATERIIDNLRFLYNAAKGEVADQGPQWYEGAHRICEEKAADYSLPVQSVVGVYASQSPQKLWDMNVYLGDRIIDIYRTKQNEPWSDKMQTTAARIWKPKDREILKRICPPGQPCKKLSELRDPDEKGVWIRTYDEAHGPMVFDRLTPDGHRAGPFLNLDGSPMAAVWQKIPVVANAVRALESGGNRDTLSQAMGSMHKVRCFYNNILDPDSDNDDVTMDTHAVGAALLSPYGSSSAQVLQSFGNTPTTAEESEKMGFEGAWGSDAFGVHGLYPLWADAYRKLAKELKIKPRVLQSVTWEAKRRLFDESMTKEAKAQVDATWRKYHNGGASLEDTHKEIFRIGGGIEGKLAPGVADPEGVARRKAAALQKAKAARIAKRAQAQEGKDGDIGGRFAGAVYEAAQHPADAREVHRPGLWFRAGRTVDWGVGGRASGRTAGLVEGDDQALLDAEFVESQHPRGGDPKHSGRFSKGRGGGGGGEAPAWRSMHRLPQLPSAAPAAPQMPGAPSLGRRAAGAAARAVHGFAREDYEILHNGWHKPGSAPRKNLSQKLVGIARSLPHLLAAHLKEEKHKAVGAARALGSFARGRKPSSQDMKSLRAFGISMMMSAGAMALTGDVTGSVGQIAAGFGHELVNHTIIEHGAKFSIGAARFGAVAAGLFGHTGHDAGFDELTPADYQLLQQFLEALAKNAADLDIPDDRAQALLAARHNGGGNENGTIDDAEPDGFFPPLDQDLQVIAEGLVDAPPNIKQELYAVQQHRLKERNNGAMDRAIVRRFPARAPPGAAARSMTAAPNCAVLALDRLPSVFEPLRSERGQLALDRDTVRRFSSDGHMHVAVSNISKATVNPYLGDEIPGCKELGLDPKKKYMLWRHPQELAKAAHTFNNLPVLADHVPVTAQKHKPELVIGSSGTDAKFVYPYLRNSLVFWTQPGIDAIDGDRQRELSCAYHYVPVMTPGVTPDGQRYDGIMTQIEGNHIALVQDGRAGADVIVADAMPAHLYDHEWQTIARALRRI